MQFGISLIMRGKAATREAFEELAEKAEAAGLDALWCSDHLVVPDLTVSRYPSRPDGRFLDTWYEGYWEPFTVLSYLAARTRRIRLGISVCILPMRNPIEVAAEVAHLDQLSGGRFNFGVGVGWFREEFEALGMPFHERGVRTDEGIALCKALWTQARPSFQGRFHSFERVHFAPKPAQKPHPPIWIAGHSPAALRRVARLADGWHPFKPSLEGFRQGKAELERLLAAEGRSLKEITLSVKGHMTFQDRPPEPGHWPLEGRPADIIEGIRRFAELGVEHILIDYLPETLPRALETLERFVQDVRPKI